ncbi:hypothetical protein REPUB_Repub03eG0165600 [Reevesia pubescens]
MLVLWLLWTNRNKCNHDHVCLTFRALIQRFKGYVKSTAAQVNPIELVIRLLEWQPPALGTIKVNVDASFHSQTGISKIRIVARDLEGNVVSSAVCAHDNINNAFIGELLAILYGMQLANV